MRPGSSGVKEEEEEEELSLGVSGVSEDSWTEIKWISLVDEEEEEDGEGE